MTLLELAEEFGQVVIYSLPDGRFQIVAGSEAVDGWEDAGAEGDADEIMAALPAMVSKEGS